MVFPAGGLRVWVLFKATDPEGIKVERSPSTEKAQGALKKGEGSEDSVVL